MESTSEARLNFNYDLRNVPKYMFEGHVLPTLDKHTIVGLGVLCDHRCVVVLIAEKSYVMHNNKLLLSGTREKRSPLVPQPSRLKKGAYSEWTDYIRPATINPDSILLR